MSGPIPAVYPVGYGLPVSSSRSILGPAVGGFPDHQSLEDRKAVAAGDHARREALEPMFGQTFGGGLAGNQVQFGAKPTVGGGGIARDSDGVAKGRQPGVRVAVRGGEGPEEIGVIIAGNEAVVARLVDLGHHLILKKGKVDHHASLFAFYMKVAGLTDGFNGVAVPVQVTAFRAVRHDAVAGINGDLAGHGKNHGIPMSLCV